MLQNFDLKGPGDNSLKVPYLPYKGTLGNRRFGCPIAAKNDKF